MPHCLLDDLGTLRFRGVDTQKFLQGQLSNDVARVTPERLLRAGLHNPHGRTLALLGLVASADGEVLGVLPKELAGVVATLLRRYVLRAKVTISDETANYRIYGLQAADRAVIADGARCQYGLGVDQRQLLLQPAAQAALPEPDVSREQWRALDIAAGLPRVSSEISGQYVAQMLNLDCIDAVSFDKGCYTGQEVIARAHYRGRVKRRMQRFSTQTREPLSVGASGQLSDGRSFRVIDATLQADGRCEFLAVTALPGAGSEAEDANAKSASAVHPISQLALPYALPD